MAFLFSPRWRMPALAAALLALAAPGAFAQRPPAWPTRPVRILVGFPGGSSPDAAARALAEPLARALGQPVIVENKVGASGNIATDQIAKAADDHTLGIVINGNLTSARMLFPRLPYDPERDFSFLTLVGTAPLVLVTRADLPDGAAFLAAAKASGDRWNYGSVGAGSVAHLGMELLKARLPGLAAQHVPYQGHPFVVTALLGRQIELALIPPGIAMAQVQAGRLRAVGLTSGRSVLAPGVPSLAELGVRDFQLEVWAALVGPAALSQAAQDRLAGVLPAILRDAGVRQQMFQQGWQVAPFSGAGLKARVREEGRIMADIIAARRIRRE